MNEENKKVGLPDMSATKIGIAGLGTVGNALRHYFDKYNQSVVCYDKYNNRGNLSYLQQAEIVFICVPTEYNDYVKAVDISEIEELLDHLEDKIIVIKSTTPPGTTEKLQERYAGHFILFNPEFLSENSAQADMEYPDRQILGYTEKSKPIAPMILDILSWCPIQRVVPAKEAEMVKYFNNTFNAIKVIFANQMYDICEDMNIDYNSVAEMAAKSKFIKTDDHLDVNHGGYRGYGGKCLPKDMNSLIEMAEKRGVNLDLLKTGRDINNNL